MEPNRPLPTPLTPEAKPYWDGLKEHKLMLPKCQDCGKAFFYPRILCPHCHSRNITWIQASGKGTLYSFEIVYQQLNRRFQVAHALRLSHDRARRGPAYDVQSHQHRA